jgi:beta-glucosidase
VGRTHLGNKINTTDKSEFAAIAVAKQADVVVMVLRTWFAVWRREKQVGYWFTRQQELLKPFIKVNPNIVLVLNNGRPLAIPWLLKIFPQLSKVAFRNAKWQWLKFVW